MGWRINTIVNEGVVPAEAYSAIKESGEREGFYFYGEGESNEFPIDSDAMEHADYMWNDWFESIVEEHKEMRGLVIWSSNEGDDAGEFWGYQIGAGHIHKLNKLDCLKILTAREEANQ